MSKKTRRAIPEFGLPIIETHCHLDYLDDDTLDQTLERARQVGVERIVTIAVSPSNQDVVFALTQQYRQVWGTQGVHPHEAEHYNDDTGALIRRRLAEEKIVAVGEIGLDYYYDHADRRRQREVFEAQLQIAAEANMPVVIHTRDADEDCAAILGNFCGAAACRGVIHSFTSGMALAEYCLAQGFMLGFNGIATFNRADNVRAVVEATPLEQLVLETDAPYLTPAPYRGRPNAPCYLPFIAEKIAEIKRCSVETVLRRAHANSEALFFTEGR